MNSGTLLTKNTTRIPVYYSPEMAPSFTSSSPSAAKPAQVVDAWLNLHLPIKIIEPELISHIQIKLVHCADYVDNILNCLINNGFGNKLPEVALSLLYTNGAMLSAARGALHNKSGVFSLVLCLASPWVRRHRNIQRSWRFMAKLG
ncbi:MAG: hypothetical protein HO273_02050 [Ferrovum myxofaciens]|nr:hypothetical protein [Ferrovum myxofaciens]QKE37666.2 MAG: hypothetical protein HO273_02050 [Ferrovum myxofaciens]